MRYPYIIRGLVVFLGIRDCWKDPWLYLLGVITVTYVNNVAKLMGRYGLFVSGKGQGNFTGNVGTKAASA